MKVDFLEFMEKMFEKAHAEVAPLVQPGHECWYLPLFGVYHPRNPDRICVVFDSSASYEGVSLNNILLTGPDLHNSLLGVVMRFRKEQVAITADIEHMFHCFLVKEDHRDFLRFLWYRNNDPTFLGIVPRLPLQCMVCDGQLRKQKPTVVVMQEDSSTASSMSTTL